MVSFISRSRRMESDKYMGNDAGGCTVRCFGNGARAQWPPATYITRRRRRIEPGERVGVRIARARARGHTWPLRRTTTELDREKEGRKNWKERITPNIHDSASVLVDAIHHRRYYLQNIYDLRDTRARARTRTRLIPVLRADSCRPSKLVFNRPTPRELVARIIATVLRRKFISRIIVT